VKQVDGEIRQPIQLIVRPALFDGDVASFNKSFLAQPSAELLYDGLERRGRRAAEQSDDRHRRLLRVRRERPSRRAAEQSDKIPSPHGSSLRGPQTLPHRQMSSTVCITAIRLPDVSDGHERPKGDVCVESVRLPTADIGGRVP
jgi:hypothetical protein